MKILFQLVAGLLSLMRLLPLSARRLLGGWAGFLFGCFPTRERLITQLQLECVFGKNKHISPRDVFRNIGIIAGESLGIEKTLRNCSETIQCDNWNELHEIMNSERGVLALTAHFGSWEILAGYMAAEGIDLTVIGREARVKPLQELLSRVRKESGVKTVWRSNTAGRREIVRGLRTPGRVVAALIDQDTQVKSEFVPFFGLPAKTPSSLIELAKRYKSRIVTAFIARTSDNTFKVLVSPLADELSVTEVLKEYNQRLEDIIRAYPEQWVWFHKRWCSQPSRSRLSSSNYITFLQNMCARRQE
jgi:Kdo2-lipid IVA lauroyltransferase/acyltransferase